MANNRNRVLGRQLKLTLTSGGVAAGDPAACGQMVGVSLGPKDGNNQAVLDTMGVYTLTVNGIDGGGNSAVAVGDVIYYVAADTPPLSKKATGIKFGYALQTLATGTTGAIQVKLAGSN